uniref:Uncharacterized protein n=1 Tax=Paramoeba aestuarina TaxID=180227 RepID=A0A7S4JLP6_9EUKA|mmetsp:Transcript_11604/g.17580  ORF Transcript_11604/g.17580 Transcript_11604/m.17580 type:complete len:277 (+) Transcript_11604:51-881(+)
MKKSLDETERPSKKKSAKSPSLTAARLLIKHFVSEPQKENQCFVSTTNDYVRKNVYDRREGGENSLVLKEHVGRSKYSQRARFAGIPLAHSPAKLRRTSIAKQIARKSDESAKLTTQECQKPGAGASFFKKLKQRDVINQRSEFIESHTKYNERISRSAPISNRMNSREASHSVSPIKASIKERMILATGTPPKRKNRLRQSDLYPNEQHEEPSHGQRRLFCHDVQSNEECMMAEVSPKVTSALHSSPEGKQRSILIPESPSLTFKARYLDTGESS